MKTPRIPFLLRALHLARWRSQFHADHLHFGVLAHVIWMSQGWHDQNQRYFRQINLNIILAIRTTFL